MTQIKPVIARSAATKQSHFHTSARNDTFKTSLQGILRNGSKAERRAVVFLKITIASGLQPIAKTERKPL